MDARYEFVVTPDRLLWLLGVIVIGLLGIHVVLTVVHYQVTELPWLVRQIWDVDEEESYPTWYSSALLGVTALFLWMHTVGCRRRRDALWGYWGGLAAGFLALSIEEVAGLHETLNSAIEISWVWPALVVVALCVGLYVQFLLALPRRLAVQFVVAGAVFLAGALGVEKATDYYAENELLDTLAYNLWTAVEEGFEMFGVWLFLRALLRHMAGERPGDALPITLEFGRDTDRPTP